uniref:Uncharacterized protein n=1 Tax=Anguilla anguilla TaxID=7936 RepID=A0A0E9QES7_ANGAN
MCQTDGLVCVARVLNTERTLEYEKPKGTRCPRTPLNWNEAQNYTVHCYCLMRAQIKSFI